MSAAQQRYTIDALRASPVQPGYAPAPGQYGVPSSQIPVQVTESKVTLEKPNLNIFLWMIITALVIGLLLWIFHPAIVQSYNASTGQLQLDWGKLILWAIGITIVIFVVLWITRGITGWFR